MYILTDLDKQILDNEAFNEETSKAEFAQLTRLYLQQFVSRSEIGDSRGAIQNAEDVIRELNNVISTGEAVTYVGTIDGERQDISVDVEVARQAIKSSLQILLLAYHDSISGLRAIPEEDIISFEEFGEFPEGISPYLIKLNKLLEEGLLGDTIDQVRANEVEDDEFEDDDFEDDDFEDEDDE